MKSFSFRKHCTIPLKLWVFVFSGPRPWPLLPICIYRSWLPICIYRPWPPIYIYRHWFPICIYRPLSYYIITSPEPEFCIYRPCLFNLCLYLRPWPTICITGLGPEFAFALLLIVVAVVVVIVVVVISSRENKLKCVRTQASSKLTLESNEYGLSFYKKREVA